MSSISVLNKIKVVKHLASDMFVNSTPKFHLELLEFLSREDKYQTVTMFRGAGKTTVVNKIDTFCDIFFEHEPYQQIFSSTLDKAKKFLNDVKNILMSAMLKGYNIKKGSIWSSTEIEVIVDDKYNCYIEVLGAGQDPRGGSFNFMRPTKQKYDDIESKVGQYAIRTKANRDKLEEWYYGDCLPSLDPTGKVRFVGTILHNDSLLMKLRRDKAYGHFTKPIISNGKSAWGNRFPVTKDDAIVLAQKIYDKTGKRVVVDSIEQIRDSLYKRGKQKLFYQEYLCKPQSEETKLFKQEDFRYFDGVVYDKNVSEVEFKNSIDVEQIKVRKATHIKVKDKLVPMSDLIVYTTMDLASDGSDKTVLTTVGYDSDGNGYILDISMGHWNPFEKSVNALRIQLAFSPIRFGIEKASAQNDFFYTIDEAQKQTSIRINVEELSHKGVNKNIRISNLHPIIFTHRLFFNKDDINTVELEAQLTTFDIEIESGEDDIMDALAYQMHFRKDRSFEDSGCEEDDDDDIFLGY
jgi:hypothetical protein